jgi:hypothetical protein
LDGRYLADDVHLQLAAKLVEGHELEWRRDRYPGVGDEAVQTGADRLGRRADLVCLRDVE